MQEQLKKLAEEWRQAANNARLIQLEGDRKTRHVSNDYRIELDVTERIYDACARRIEALSQSSDRTPDQS